MRPTSSSPRSSHSTARSFPCGLSSRLRVTAPGTSAATSWLTRSWRKRTVSGPRTQRAACDPSTSPALRRSAKYSAVTSP